MSEYQLNKSQKEAVEYNNGPLLIIAGAGTGKTTVITQKIKYILDQKLAKAEEVLALTFNEKAAAEMQSRVDAMLESSYSETNIHTFHAFCRALLEQYGLDIGLPNEFKVIDETDAWLLVKKNFDLFALDYYRPMGNPSRHIHELIKHFHKCKDELISPEEYNEYAQNIVLDKDLAGDEERGRLSELASAYHQYNRLLLDKGCLDFADLIFYANKLLEKRPSLKEKIQQQFKYILVDEFQDVNYSQYELVKKMSGRGFLTAVGDDDQSIYAFRGASVANILRFQEDFAKAQEIVLKENYRSGAAILEKAYDLIQNNNPDRLEVKLKIDKRLKAKKTGVGQVIHSHARTVEEEAAFVADEILKIKEKDKEITWDDFAILARANSHVEPFMNELARRKIPYEFLAAAGLYRQPIVLDVLNFLKLLDNYRDATAIFRLLHLPFFELSENDSQKITFFAKKKGLSYYEVLKRAAEVGLSQAGVKIADRIISLIHSGLKNSRFNPPTIILYKFMEESGYLKYLTKGEEAGNRAVIRGIHHLNQFFEYIRNYENLSPGANVRDFLMHFADVLDSGDSGILKQPEDTPDSVNIMTVHTAKGLEYKYVFVVNLVEERFPLRRRGSEAIEIPLALIKERLPEGDAHYQEERRLMYVAMTRAKERLYLTSADDYGGARCKKPSRFLVEAGFNIVESEKKEKKVKPISFVESNEKGGYVYKTPDVFSFSQVQMYQQCPYKYKLKTVLALPGEGSPSLTFGTVIHNTLLKFYKRLLELNQSEQVSLFSVTSEKKKEDKKAKKEEGRVKAPSLDELLEIYKQCWVPDWYKDTRQHDDFFDKGTGILKEFYKDNEKKWTIPIALEKGFKLKIGGYMVRGKIDRIDLVDGKMEIVDYKTGKAKEKITGEDKDQLLVYQMALSFVPELASLGKPEKLTYYYLTDQSKQSFLGNEKDLAKLEEKFAEVFARIKARDFAATPEKFTCEHCDYKDICDYRA